MEYTYIGLDVSADKADMVRLNEPLNVSPRDYYESEEFSLHHAELSKTAHSLSFIESLKPTVIILEPTSLLVVGFDKRWVRVRLPLNRVKVPALLKNQPGLHEFIPFCSVG